MNIAKFLKDNGYEVVEGKDAVLNAIDNISDTNSSNLCSGYRVFPNGDKCKGCSDCKE